MHNRKRSTVGPSLSTVGRRNSVVFNDPLSKSPRQVSTNPLRIRTMLCTVPKPSSAPAGGCVISLDNSIISGATSAFSISKGHRQRYDFDAAVSLDEVFCSTSSTGVLDELRAEMLEGQNSAILSCHSSRTSSALWGSSSSILRPCVMEILRSLDETGRSYEIMISMFVISEGRVRDLLSDNGKLLKPSVTQHAATGPRFLGMQYSLIRNMPEFDKTFEQGKQSFLSDKKSSSTMMMSLVLKQSLNKPSGAPHVLLSSLLVCDAADRSSFFTKLIEGNVPQEIATLFSGAIGGNCFTVAIGCLCEDDDTATASACLNTLQRLGAVNSSPRKHSVVEDIVAEVREQLSTHRERISNPAIDSIVRQRLEKEAVGMEMNLQELEASLSRAVERQVVTTELLRLNEAKNANEIQMRKALVAASSEKQKRFAQAFRAAFATSTNSLRHSQRQSELIEEVAAMQRERNEHEQKCSALKQENSRLQFAVRSHETTIAELSRQKDALALRVEELNHCLVQKDELLMQAELQYQRTLFGETVEATDRSANVATLEAENAALRKQILEANGKIASLVQLHRRESLDEEITKEISEKSERRRFHDTMLRLHDSEVRQEHAMEEVRILRSRLAAAEHATNDISKELARAIEKQSEIVAKCHDALKKQKTLYSIERDAYIDFLSEGRGFLAELQNYRNLFIKTPSAYRGGQEELAAWLAAIGLESMLSTLTADGFDTLHAVSIITEADLVKMQVLTGNRRKFLFAAADLSRRLDAAYHHSMSAFFNRSQKRKDDAAAQRSATHNDTVSDVDACHSGTDLEWQQGKDARRKLAAPLGLDQLLEEFDAWLHDFNESVMAEEEVSDQLEFEIL